MFPMLGRAVYEFGNNKNGAQMLIKAFYFKEELIRLDCSVNVEQLGRLNLLWYKTVFCPFPVERQRQTAAPKGWRR